MKNSLYEDLYAAFLKVAEKYGDEIFTMSCYAKYGVHSLAGRPISGHKER